MCWEWKNLAPVKAVPRQDMFAREGDVGISVRPVFWPAYFTLRMAP